MSGPTFKPAVVVKVRPPTPSPHRPALGPHSPGRPQHGYHGEALGLAPESPPTPPFPQKSTPSNP